jgi:hypothetical protein
MPTPVNQQEIYLLERYISLDYFAALRDTWAELVKHVESCLESFMQNLPATYRTRPLPEQPDVVWGHRVLPNFRNTLQNLNTGFILLSHGDVKGLNYAHGPRSDFKGQMDYWAGWMARADEDLYNVLLDKAVAMAHNIVMTEGAYWPPRSLSNYCEDLEPLNPPAQRPAYRIDKNVSVCTGEKTTLSGIYIPDVDNSCAEFLSSNYEQAPPAIVHVGFEDLLHPITGEKSGEQPLFEKRNCVWYFVERTAELAIAPQGHALEVLQLHRVAAGETCPETGFYLTPARPESRRLFQQGEVMPAFETTYGTTIWQWDSNQG